MGTEYTLNKSIFHAFNMRYTNIEVKAREIAEAGFTHIQFPVVQEARGFKNYYELVKKQLDKKLYDQTMVKYYIIARLKEEKFPGNNFLTLYKQRKNYINQPILVEVTSLYESKEFFDLIWKKFLSFFDLELFESILNHIAGKSTPVDKTRITNLLKKLRVVLKNINDNLVDILVGNKNISENTRKFTWIQ
jgi:hypothetical protein